MIVPSHTITQHHGVHCRGVVQRLRDLSVLGLFFSAAPFYSHGQKAFARRLLLFFAIVCGHGLNLRSVGGTVRNSMYSMQISARKPAISVHASRWPCRWKVDCCLQSVHRFAASNQAESAAALSVCRCLSVNDGIKTRTKKPHACPCPFCVWVSL